MNKGTKIKLGFGISLLSGLVFGYIRNKAYYKKYPFLKELRSLFSLKIPAAIINPTCIRLINKSLKDKFVECSDVMTSSRRIKSSDGTEILINVMEPLNCNKEEELPCLIYFHGGAYVLEALKGYYSIMAKYVNQINCKVIFVHYRTVYETSCDTCFEDAYSSLIWAYDNAETLHIDRRRIAVGGDSAGGGIAAAITHIARDRKGPKICFQMLLYPVVDSTLSTPSMKKFAGVPGWNAKVNSKMWKEIKKRISPEMMKYVSPLLNSDFSELCDAYVEVEEFDCLHDEGLLYSEKLSNNGYKVQINDMKGTYHGFDQNQKKLIARQIIEVRAKALRKAFGTVEF